MRITAAVILALVLANFAIAEAGARMGRFEIGLTWSTIPKGAAIEVDAGANCTGTIPKRFPKVLEVLRDGAAVPGSWTTHPGLLPLAPKPRG